MGENLVKKMLRKKKSKPRLVGCPTDKKVLSYFEYIFPPNYLIIK